MIIYIHGFGGCGFGVKAKLFKEHFKNLITPSLPYQPYLAVDTLSQLISAILPYERVSLIGSSLGGYYSIFLANRFDLKYVLINPAISPQNTLQNHIGMVQSYYDESSFAWTDLHIKDLGEFRVKNPNQENCMLLLQKEDEVLDYKDALNFLPDAKIILEEGGSHSFSGIERHFDAIGKFLL